jgi:hypothetical protein
VLLSRGYVNPAEGGWPDDDGILVLVTQRLPDRFAAHRGWKVHGVHVDRTIGTTKGRTRLRGLSALLAIIAHTKPMWQ